MSVVVAGATGLAGSAIVRAYEKAGEEVIGINRNVCDLLDRDATIAFIKKAKPAIVVDAAAKVGGIGANNAFPVEFLADNVRIQSNLMEAAHAADVEKFIFLGSSCIYPRDCAQPIKEEYLLTGPLEETNSAYAIAKIAGLKLIEAYRDQFGHQWISAMPTNLYGPRDNFNLETAHVLPTLIHRIHNAKVNCETKVEVWGDGTPLREFLYVDDLAKACLTLLKDYDEAMAINIGSSQEISIRDLAALISKAVGYTGEIVFNTDRPNGTPRKLLDSTRISELGWKPQVRLEDGVFRTYNWFLTNLTKEAIL